MQHLKSKDREEAMTKGKRYDKMTSNPQSDVLNFFENYQENMKHMQSRVKVLNPLNVYDLGCGTGNLVGPLSQFYNVIGIDISKEMLEELKQKFPEVVCVESSVIEWLRKTEFTDQDVLVSSFVLHGIKNKKDFFTSISKALRSGAQVLIMDYMFEDPSSRRKFVQKLVSEEEHGLVDLINSKEYMLIDQVKKWCLDNSVLIDVTQHTRWIYTIHLSQ